MPQLKRAYKEPCYICPHCSGSHINEGDTECVNCGHPLNGYTYEKDKACQKHEE